MPGTDVRLTIDRDIQYVAQKAIAKAVAVDPVAERHRHRLRTRAPATCSRWRPRRPSTRTSPGSAPAEDRGNRPLTEAYEPGSTGKVITASALIEEGVITPTTPITVPNRLTRAGQDASRTSRTTRCQHLTYAGTIAKSSNIGTIRAAERLGNLKRLYPYLQEVRHRRADRARPAGRGVRRAAQAAATGRRPAATR